MLPTGHTVLPAAVPSQKSSFVACKPAYAFDSRDINQEVNGYWWESWETEGERSKDKLASVATIFRNVGNKN